MGDYLANGSALEGGRVDAATLISQLKQIVDDPQGSLQGVDTSQRNEIQRLSLTASRVMEQPFETMMRLAYAPLPLVASRIGQDRGVFRALSSSEGPMSLAALSKATDIKPLILDPFVDYLCAQHMARQVAPGSFVATKLTHHLTEPLLTSAITHFHNSVMSPFANLNETLKNVDSGRSAFQNAFQTDVDLYTWFKTHPTEREAFHHFMEVQMSSLPAWLVAVNFEPEFAPDVKPDEAVFVDVGGGIGQQCQILREALPDLQGRVVLQDKPYVVENALSVPGLEKMAYDYFTEQPIKGKSSVPSVKPDLHLIGARVYYFRQIMHNNSDETCLQILKNTSAAMDERSVIIIDDKVLSDDKPPPDAPGVEYKTSLSLAMLAMFNAQERYETHWRQLIAEAGLVIKDIRKFTQFEDAVIIVKKPA